MEGDFLKVPRPENAYDATSDAEDGLEACRGLRSAVIIEALAVGAVWGVYELAQIVAAWWRS